MSNETEHGPAFDVVVGDHRFRRNENGVVSHQIAGAPDHSANGLTTTLELFAREIVRLRERVGEEPGGSAPPARDPLGG